VDAFEQFFAAVLFNRMYKKKKKRLPGTQKAIFPRTFQGLSKGYELFGFFS